MTLTTHQFLQAASALQAKEMDGLALFRPTVTQEDALRRMCEDHVFESLIVGGNRSGKSVLAASFFASFLRDIPITSWSGEEFHCRPKRLNGQSINAWVIGDHLKHIGMTIYRLLFDEDASKGLFKIVRDEVTGAWRAWQPEMFANDWDRKSQSRWAPPVIPPAEIEEISWAVGRKKEHEFRAIKMKNKTTIHGFASSGEVKQGDPVDLIWNDEEIFSASKHYYQEWLMRLRDDEGMLIWSTIPRDSCYVFNSVIDRMEDQELEIEKGERKPEECHTAKIELSYLDSPFIPQRQKDLALEQAGDRDTMIRIYGKRSSPLIRVYQDYNADFHVVNYNEPSLNDKVTEALAANNWVPPHTWTRELILDPGTQKPGVLMGAVPPPDMWDEQEPYFICYREIFIRRASPGDLAKQIMLTEKSYVFERFIIDGRMGRQTPPGFVETVDYQYEKAFRAVGLQSRQTGSGFIAGDDDFSRRSKQVIRSLRTRQCGRPQLRIINQTCPNLVRQMMTNVRKTSPAGDPTEIPADNQVDDMRVTLEYWLSRRPTFHARADEAPDERDMGQLAYQRLIDEHKMRNSSLPRQTNYQIGVPA